MSVLKWGKTEGAPAKPAPRASRFRLLVALSLLGLLLPVGGALVTGAGPAAAAVGTTVEPAPTETPETAETPEAPEPAPIAPIAPAPTPSPSLGPVDPTPTPTPSPSEPPGDPDPIASPAITSPSNGTLVSGAFAISGTAEPGAGVQVSASSRSDPLCTTVAGTDGGWLCNAGTLPSGPGVELRVVQLVDGHDNESDTISVNVLNAPTATSGSTGGVSTGYGTVRGTALAGATVTADASGASGSYTCTVAADGAGGWACNLGSAIPSGNLQLQATQSTSWSGGDSAASPVFTLQIDSDVPQPPRVTAPAKGGSAEASGATFAGTGESGALVTVFAGSFAACTARVQSGSWGCAATGLAAGTFPVSAIQQDAAGNVSDESAAFVVTFVAGTPTPTPTATPGSATPTPGASGAAGSGSANTGDPTENPGSGTSGTDPGAAGGTGSSGTTPGDGSAPAAPGSPSDSGSGPSGAAPANPHAADGSWAGSTRFTAALQPVFGSTSGMNWLIALAVALGALVLVAAPAKLMVGALSAASQTRRRRRSTLLTGRNRPRAEFERAPELSVNPWILASVTLVASAAVGMLSGPVESQPAYLRLFAAICIAFAVLNVVSVVVPNVLGRRMFGVTSRITFAPRYLVFAAIASLLSRVFTIEPALLFGLVLAIGCAESAAPRAKAQFALLRLLSPIVLGGLAWGAASILPTATSPWVALATEVLNTLVLGSFGAAAVLVLPFGRLAGRALFAWSRAAWLATALGSFTLLAAVVAPAVSTATGRGALFAASSAPALVPALLVAVGFAAVSISVWAWVRFVAPALR